MPCMAIANTCSACCFNCFAPFQPIAGSQSSASLLSRAVQTLWMCHCPSCSILEMSSIDSYFSNLRLWFLSPSFVTALKALSRTATCLLGFPWKGKIFSACFLKTSSAVSLQETPTNTAAYPIPFWEHPGLSSSHPQHHKHPQQAYRPFLFWYVSSRMLVLGWELSPVYAVIQVAGGEGNHAPHSFCWSSQ